MILRSEINHVYTARPLVPESSFVKLKLLLIIWNCLIICRYWFNSCGIISYWWKATWKYFEFRMSKYCYGVGIIKLLYKFLMAGINL
jgi:hypothetical protein